MGFLQNIYNQHKAYNQEQKKEGQSISFKQILLILLVGIPYLAVFMIGFHLDARTIISHNHLLIITSLLAIVFYVFLYLFAIKMRKDLKIIWNVIILYVHAVLFFSSILLLLNYLTVSDTYHQTSMEVINWEETSARSGDKTWATVKFEDHVSALDFNGHMLDSVGNVKYIEVELSKGLLGFAYVKSYRLP